MNFASVQYLVFIVVVFFIYWQLSRRWQNIFILAASYFFYAMWDWRLLSLIMITTAANHVCGHRIAASETPRRRRYWLVASLTVSLGILAYFKYFNFFADSLVDLANGVGWHLSDVTMKIILPVGISFYTFQAISYSIDIYRRQLVPVKSLLTFAAFVAFFPQLVAGPIVRAKEFVHQLEGRRQFIGSDFEFGLRRFLFGFFKKVFVADTIGYYLVDPVFADPSSYSTATLWLALLGWSVQIYADFSGYSSMAIGSARILGFTIPENFNFPYLSKNISQYWRRWHMTMSRFFRDYVYVGLGGNRRGLVRSLLNIAITTTVSGLWHGAGWTFVVWGWLHGFMIAVYQIWREIKKKYGLKSDRLSWLLVIPAWLLTQAGISLSRILFRSPDFPTAWAYTKGLFGSPGGLTLDVSWLVFVGFGAVVVDHVIGYLLERRPDLRLVVPAPVQGVVYTSMVLFLFHFRPEHLEAFVYFQF